jgi:dolichyl-phosphate beta-glucosyltransferase
MAAPQLSVVIPAYNEEIRLGRTLPTVLEYLRSRPQPSEVLVVDDGSHDSTADLVHRLAEQDDRVKLVRYQPNRGKGYAVRVGMLSAGGALRLFSDADLSTPVSEVERLEASIQAGCDIAIGSRAVAGSCVLLHQPAHRELLGKAFNLMVRALVVPGIRDTQCGFKLFSAHAAETVFPQAQIEGFGFDVELMALARQAGLRIAEVGVTWTDDPNSRVHPAKDSARIMRDLWAIRRRLGRPASSPR